jgi:hypothetical protein
MSAYTMPSELQRFAEFLAANPSPVNVVAGKYYNVPCAVWPFKTRNYHPKFIPLLGTVHEDRDIVKFNPWHIHVDTRFLTMKLYQQEAVALARPFSLTTHWPNSDILLKEASANLVLRKTKARRANPPEWPRRSSYWLPALESTYANASAACGVCPHRQIPLSAGLDMGNGVTQCPGHGLCWDRNGKLIKNVNKKASK